MAFVHHLVLLLHFVGFAALFGGAFVQLKDSPRRVNTAMFHGVLTQFITGVVLVVFRELGDEPVNHAKVGIKLAVLIAVGIMVVLNRKKDILSNGMFWAILGLTLTDAAVAVLV